MSCHFDTLTIHPVKLMSQDKELTVAQSENGYDQTPALGSGSILESNENKLSSLLGFPIDTRLVLQHLKQDMRDDWYFDVLQYDDLFRDPNYCETIIANAFQEGHGVYLADTPTVRGIPKKGFSERYALETDFFDRFVYQAAVSYLIPFIDPLLSNRVLSYRYEKYPRQEKYLFKNKIDRWNTFEGITLTFKFCEKYLAVTDLTNFFEGISSDFICRKLIHYTREVKATGIEKKSIRAAIECLRSNLQHWSFSSGVGLPQNRDASSFLSNVMLVDVDNAMVKMGFDYYRYVDDIRIICPTESDARKSLVALIGELRKLGLSLNGAKTQILSPKSPEIENVFPALDTVIASIDSMWKSRSRRVVSRSVKYICEVVKDKMMTGTTQSRTFRFAVNRLSILIQAGLIDVNDPMVNNLKSTLIDSLYDHAVSTDQYCRILNAIDPEGTCCSLIEQYILDRSKSIYDWQNYNLWLFLARRRHTSDPLKAEAKRVITEQPKCGESAAILIWGLVVEYRELTLVALDLYLKMKENGSDESWPFLNQRNFLMSASSLDNKEIERLFGKQHYKLAKTIDRCTSLIQHEKFPFTEPERKPLEFLIEEASGYVG